jgi:thioredoxin 1
MSIPKVTATELAGLISKQNSTVLAKFFATWCGPCRQFAPVLEKFAADHPEITCCELDIDDSDNIKLITELEISTVPTVIIWRNGEITARTSGFLNMGSLTKLMEQ